MATKARLRANRRYKRKHKQKNRISSYRSTCKNYILKYSTKDDLNKNLPNWMQIRRKRMDK